MSMTSFRHWDFYYDSEYAIAVEVLVQVISSSVARPLNAVVLADRQHYVATATHFVFDE